MPKTTIWRSSSSESKFRSCVSRRPRQGYSKAILGWPMGDLRCYISWLKLSLSQVAEFFELLSGGSGLDKVKLSKYKGFRWMEIHNVPNRPDSVVERVFHSFYDVIGARVIENPPCYNGNHIHDVRWCPSFHWLCDLWSTRTLRTWRHDRRFRVFFWLDDCLCFAIPNDRSICRMNHDWFASPG